jgi:hypothetical protein
MKQQIDDLIDLVKVTFAGAGALTVTLTNINLLLKVLIGIATLGYIIRKWYKMEKAK